ncbi:MAG: EAL domain-containing protein [Desulfuromonadaceae bacterium]|nr:EAL domain-containing protein [Desulfuromonadaceae bacterium]
MTLYRQLIIFTFFLFLLLFVGTWYAKLQSTRSFLTSQLESHAQDTATSLALSISPHIAEKDMAAVESMINAVFDRGYYQMITFTDPRQKVLFEDVLDVKVKDVPDWFVRWIQLKTPEATSDVMAGWNQAGTIHVKSHPGYAYATLWKDVLNMTAWFAACAVFVFVAGGLGLQILLKPLVAVERQADALCRKEYRIQLPLPWTKEFRRVAEAMNRMTSKVKEMFEEQAAQAEGLQERAYHDPLTGLGNRRYFESQITGRLDQHDINAKGVVLLVRIHNLETLNQRRGFQAGDELLKRVALLLKGSSGSYANAAFARLTGGDFGIFVPDASLWDGENIATDMANRLGQIVTEQIAATDNIGHIGAAAYDDVTTLGRLLSEADLALGSAMQKGANTWDIRAITSESGKTPLGQQQWRDILVKALQDRRITLHAQPVVKTEQTHDVMHLEIFSKIVQDDGELLNAAIFMPLAERLKLVSTIDRIVIEEVMKIDFSQLSVNRVAINLSPASLEDDSFNLWVRTFLKSLSPETLRINFEFSEFAAVQHMTLVKEFGAAVRECGHGIGLDHYGQSFSKLGYLQSLRPEYVKIDRAYTGELKDEENDSRFYIASLCGVAHSIDIAVIAEGVEFEQQAQILRELNLDAMQGYFTGKPQPVAKRV